MSSEPSISWGQFQKAYIGCIAKLAEFTTELAVDAHSDLGLAYTDPFSARTRRQSDIMKDEQHRTKSHDEFTKFAASIRKNQPFLRKATEKELEGIFSRLSPAEKRRYSEEAVIPDRKQKTSLPSPPSTEKEKKRPAPRAAALEGFIDDEVEEDVMSEYSDDVSLVSESVGDMADDVSETEELPKLKKIKKQKKESSTSRPAGIKKFTWS